MRSGVATVARQCLTEFDVCLFCFSGKMREIQIVFQYFQPTAKFEIASRNVSCLLTTPKTRFSD